MVMLMISEAIYFRRAPCLKPRPNTLSAPFLKGFQPSLYSARLIHDSVSTILCVEDILKEPIVFTGKYDHYLPKEHIRPKHL